MAGLRKAAHACARLQVDGVGDQQVRESSARGRAAASAARREAMAISDIVRSSVPAVPIQITKCCRTGEDDDLTGSTDHGGTGAAL